VYGIILCILALRHMISAAVKRAGERVRWDAARGDGVLGCAGGRLGARARYRSDCAGWLALLWCVWSPISGLVHLVPMEEDETKRCGSSVPRMHLLCLLLLVCCHPGNPEIISSHRCGSSTFLFTAARTCGEICRKSIALCKIFPAIAQIGFPAQRLRKTLAQTPDLWRFS
jgi:hypothetical protein